MDKYNEILSQYNTDISDEQVKAAVETILKHRKENDNEQV